MSDARHLRAGEVQLAAQSTEKAMELFNKAAELGDTFAPIRLGKFLLDGKGVKTIEFYERLDELDDKEALLNIAQIYAEGCGDIQPDAEKALAFYKQSAERGNWDAKMKLNQLNASADD